MLGINEVGSVPTQVEQKTVFTSRKITSVGIREGQDTVISYTDCSDSGDVMKSVTIPFSEYQDNLEQILNNLIIQNSKPVA